ncbi:MAG: hypothetical protein SGILL_009472 [Bacillariaceae sp.]
MSEEPQVKKRKASETFADDETTVPLKAYKELQRQLAEAQATIESLRSAAQSQDEDLSDDETNIDLADPFNQKFVLLRAFRIREGHCKVPQKDPQIGQWVNNQKRAYKNVKTGKKGLKITDERVAMLDSLGFNWGKNFPQSFSWEEGMAELKKFHAAMGHANIPINANNQTPVAKWIRAQRAEWKRFLLGKDSLLDLDKIAELKQLGFRRKVN